MWQMKLWTFFELVGVSFCVQEASLFSLAPHSLIEGGIFWLIRLQIITVSDGIVCVIIICNPVWEPGFQTVKLPCINLIY